ncbi:hypothetical protein GWI33_007112, partial [Rhynchophorus ferrugineus]
SIYNNRYLIIDIDNKLVLCYTGGAFACNPVHCSAFLHTNRKKPSTIRFSNKKFYDRPP